MQTQEVTIRELRQYAMARAPKLTLPATAQQWTAEAQRRRKDIIENLVFRGWPAEWLNSPPKFEDLGTIEGGKGYRMRKLRYEIVPGFQSTAILYEPDPLVGKVPAILNVNGHVGQEGKAVEYKQKRCINFAKGGMLALNLEWIGMGELTNPENQHWFSTHLDLVGTSAVGLFYLALRRGLDYLDAHPNVDQSRVGMTGLSGGGWQTILLSSLDERVAVAIPVAGYSAFISCLERNADMGDVEQHPTDFFATEDYTYLTAMRAPRPTLLINNSEDNCCYVGPVVRPYIYDQIRPFFKLFGKDSVFAYHENLDPGTHNYQLDNRLAAYRFFSQHFKLPPITKEIPVEGEIKSAAELAVGLPKDNLTIAGLARMLAQRISRAPVPSTAAARAEWAAAQRPKLRSIVRYQPVTLQRAWALANTKNKGVESISYRFEMTNALDATGVWLKAIAIPTSAPVTIVLHDEGKKAASAEVSDRVNRGEQVLAADLLFTGDLATTEAGARAFPELLASLGERPLGIEAAQLIALADWLRTTSGRPNVRLEVTGMRNQTAALVAAALEPDLFSEVEVHQGMRSLRYLLDKPVSFLAAPDLFCFGLYKEFDLDDLEALAGQGRTKQSSQVRAVSN